MAWGFVWYTRGMTPTQLHHRAKPNSRWSSFNIRFCACGNKLYRGNPSGLCWLCSRKTTLGGANHYNWKGGITPLNKKVRNSPEYRTWRQQVFERDDFTCQRCKKRGVYLEANHALSFANFPDLRFEVLNGETLCRPCHLLAPNHGIKAVKYDFI